MKSDSYGLNVRFLMKLKLKQNKFGMISAKSNAILVDFGRSILRATYIHETGWLVLLRY